MAPVRHGIAALILGAAPCALFAQGAVSGQISILERAGNRTSDLGNAVVYLDPSGGAQPATRETSMEIAMHGKEYIPHVRVITAGSTVKFLNQDPFRHNVFSNASAGPFDLGLAERGVDMQQTFKRAGAYPVFCNIHARMAAFVIAVGTPYFVQAGADGRFSIAGVPAGKYTLHVWHERGGEQTRELDVPRDGVSDISVQLDARGYKPRPHKNKFGQDYTAAGRERY
jgi:plastocyanin